MKKLFALLIVALMIMSAFAAFAEEIQLTDQEMTIELWDIATEDPKKTIEESAVKAFMADYPNIHVNITHIANDTYKQQLVIAMANDSCPNAYIHWTGGPMNEYYQSGFCDPIDDLFEKYNKTDYLASALAMCSANDGKLIALPYGGLSAAVVYYNKSIFEANGIEIPTTIAELEAACDKLLAAGNTPFSCANGSKWTGSLYYMYLVARYGGAEAVAKAYDPNLEGAFTDEPFVKAAAKIQEWVQKGYFPAGVNSIEADHGADRQLIYTEECAMLVQLSSTAGSMKNDMGDWYTENIGAFKFPIDEESAAAGIDQTIAVGSAVGNAFSFNTKGDEEMRKALFVLLDKYYAADAYTLPLVQQVGKVASINGMQQYIEDPVVMVSWDTFADASNVQLFYDQYLPASVAEVHKNTMSDLFGLTATPEEICQKLQAASQTYLAEK